MFDVAFRSLQHPKDFGPVVHRHKLVFVERNDLGHNTVAFTFTPKRAITWKSGQHGIFSLPNHYIHGKTWRVFSLASAPREGNITIATTIPPEPSSFKQALLSLAPGDEIVMRGPIGDMYIHPKDTRIIGVAGGIGITPFRAILHDFISGAHPNRQLDLIYAGKDNFFAFAEACQTAAAAPNVRVQYVQTPDEVNSALDALAVEYRNNASYLLSGSPGMINAITTRLTEAGITNVHNDPFKGY